MQSLILNELFIYKHRVSYSETDKMQFLHHSNYARIYENARWEYLRSLNIPYSHIEEQGIMMPVINMDFKFIKPALYDDNLKIEVKLHSFSNVKITFAYLMYNESNELINKANVTLAFINSVSGKAIRIPSFIKEKLLLVETLV